MQMFLTGLGLFIIPYLLGLVMIPLAGIRESLKDFVSASYTKHRKIPEKRLPRFQLFIQPSFGSPSLLYSCVLAGAVFRENLPLIEHTAGRIMGISAVCHRNVSVRMRLVGETLFIGALWFTNTYMTPLSPRFL